MKRLTLLFTCFIMSMVLAIAQNKQVSGTVLDENEEPITGASVFAKGTTTIGTVTDLNGNYSFSVPVSVNTLVVSYLGYVGTEVPASTNVKVKLNADTKALNEVVVTALGISRDKKTLGYAVSSMKGEDIVNSNAINPMTAIQGKVAGVDVSSSQTPGGTQNVTIRGFNSFGNNQPLYVVDGIPLTNKQNQTGSISQGGPNTLNSQADFGSGINALNPKDIESVTILKGSAASALYGSRAAQGVVMITTKSGKNTNGKVNVEYMGGITIQQVGRLPNEQTMFGQGWSGDRALDENGNWGARFDGKNRVWGNVVDGTQLVKPYVYLKNRIRDFYDLGVGFDNSLSLTGGTEQTKYHVSVSQNHLDGPVPTNIDSYNRYTIATNASHKTNKVLVSTAFNFSIEKNSAAPTGQDNSIYRSLNEIATDISIVDLKDYNNKFNNLDNYFTPYGLNPYYVIASHIATQDKYKFFGKVQLDYDLLKNLKLTYRFGGDFETSTADMHTDAVFFTPDSPNDGIAGTDPGSYSQDKRQYVQTNHDYFATFNDRFNDFSVNVIAGGNANGLSTSRLYGSISSIDVPGFYNLANSLTPAVAEQYNSLYRILGAYVNADFGYRDYLYLTLSARNDWSSALPKGNNSYFYPASMLSFILSDYLKQQNINTGALDFAKVRLAYGRTGKDTDPYGVYTRFVPGTVLNPGYPKIDDLKFPLGGVNAYTISNTAANPKLKPELTDEFEFGFESSFFKQRVGLDFSYYNKLTKGLIWQLPMDPSTGFTTQRANIGDVRNKGVELTLSLVPVKTKDFQWDMSYNFTKNYNKAEKLNTPEINLSGFGGMGIYAVEGKSLGQYKCQIAQTVKLDDGIEHTVVDGAGNPQPTANIEYTGKDINEKYRMGFTNTFTYKGISLTGVFDFRFGGYIYSYTKDYMYWVGSGPESVYNDRNPFLIPNSVVDNGDGTYSENTTPVNPTALHTFYSNGGFKYADFAIIDRSYLKLRNLSLAYQLPKKVCEKLRIASLRLSASATNLLLWTPKENQYMDPEITTWGNDISAKFGEFGTTPPYQSYIFGLQLTF